MRRGNPNLDRLGAQQGRARMFRELGSLYVSGEQDTAEELATREELEALGIPMGYGRVGRVPTQLDDYQEARAQFRRAR